MKDDELFYEDPLIKTFFENTRNLSLLERVIKFDDYQAAELLDTMFAQFYLKVRLKSYSAKLTRYYSKSFDERRRKQRLILQLNKYTDSNEELISFIPDIKVDPTDSISNNILDLLPTIEMRNRYKNLSFQKKEILKYYTFYQLNNKEIAKLLSCTPQNISKLKRDALSSLKGDETNGRSETESDK